jgi:hypothetical protein
LDRKFEGSRKAFEHCETQFALVVTPLHRVNGGIVEADASSEFTLGHTQFCASADDALNIERAHGDVMRLMEMPRR